VSPEEQEVGRRIRREVLGEAWVEQSKGGGDPVMQPKTALSEYVWSKIWARPGLERKERSLINLALLTAMNRPHELELHINAALNNGLPPEKIMEVFLQCSSYCGVAAGKDSVAIARRVFASRGVG